ncbi:MAG: HTTM domain-containing protein [Gemmatimonadota bacterium]|nr:HTTM domain-containing protein [Gemmatimonadota bacterium]
MTRQVDGAPIAVFRILFGALMFVEVLRYWKYGRIARYYVDPAFFFPFVEGIRPCGNWMYLVYALMGASLRLPRFSE